MNKFKELNSRVINWANDKGILDKGTPMAQNSKTKEEVAELEEALLAQNNNLETYIDSKGRVENTSSSIKYELAGCLVTLLVQAKLQNLEILECLELEINKIEKRSGSIKNGQFVKDAN